MQIFISHSSVDVEIAGRLCNYLEVNGQKCFLAPRDIRMGKEYAEEIINGIENSDAMILLMSNAANQSPHVLREIERAVSKGVPIFVYKLEEVELSKSLEYFLMTHQWLDVKREGDFSEVLLAIRHMESAGEKSAKENTPCRAAIQDRATLERMLQEKPVKRSGKCKVWMVVAALCVLVLAGIGIWMIVGGGTNTGNVACVYEVGDTLTFGTYNGESIEWRVLRLSEDGTTAVLVAKDILTFKAFDAAESGTYNANGEEDYWVSGSAADTDLELQRLARGNNDWSVSNIRTWLNATSEVVTYADQPPMASAMAEKRNGYHNEPGFLHGFSEEELVAILPTTLETKGNALREDVIVTEDLVYLLAVEELAWFEEAGISKLAIPTQAAMEQDQSNWYAVEISEFGTQEYYWWLRDPVEGTTSVCYMVNNGYTTEELTNANAGLEGFGIRPAMTVNLQADCFCVEQ